jgi:hypothetical protein
MRSFAPSAIKFSIARSAAGTMRFLKMIVEITFHIKILWWVTQNTLEMMHLHIAILLSLYGYLLCVSEEKIHYDNF